MENLRLGVSAVRHDMRREETVEEAEKNTELECQTPKRGVGGSSPFCDASSQCRKPLFSRAFGFFHYNFQMQQILTVRARLKKVVLSLHGKTKSDKAKKREMPC